MKKTNIDIIGIIFSFVLGLLIGVFISKNLSKEDLITVSNSTEEKFIYIVEAGRFDNIDGAKNIIDKLESKNHEGKYIKLKLNDYTLSSNEIYIVICGIYHNEDLCNALCEILINDGINATVKKEYLYSLIERVDSNYYEIYQYFIECYYNIISNNEIQIDKKYLMGIDKKSLLQDLIVADSLGYEYAKESILEIYKTLKE